MRVVLFTGSRDLVTPEPVFRELDAIDPTLVIHGAARGGDAAADEWARVIRRDVISIEAAWDRHGKSAGARRNARLVALALRYAMAGHEVVCLAMPGPQSRGTHDCAKRAAAAGLCVVMRPL